MTTWQIDWDGHVWTEADVTVGHLAAFVIANGADEWDSLNPFAGPGKLMGIVAVMLAHSTGRSVDEAMAEIARAPAAKLLNALSEHPGPTPDDDEPADEPEVVPPVRPRPAATRRTGAKPRK